eukprot:5503907-Prymnesium_polylepis.1
MLPAPTAEYSRTRLCLVSRAAAARGEVDARVEGARAADDAGRAGAVQHGAAQPEARRRGAGRVQHRACRAGAAHTRPRARAHSAGPNPTC